MFEPTTAQLLFDRVAADLRSETIAAPAKSLARSTNLAGSMLKRAREGRPPGRTANFLWALKRLGPEKARRILRPIIGSTDITEAFASLGRSMEAASHELRKVVAALPPGAIDQLAHLSAEAELREGGNALGAAAARRLSLAAPAAAAPRRVHAAARPTGKLSLVAVRRHFVDIEGTGLGSQVDGTVGIESLDAARRYAEGSPWIGLAYRSPGADDWTIEPAADNRFWRGVRGPVPLTAFPAADQVEGLRRGFEEAIAERRILLEHTGWDAGRHVHALIARLGIVAHDGTEMVLAPFERRAA